MTTLVPGGLPGVSRTIAVRLSQRDGMAWPAKDPLDVLPSWLDLTATLLDLGLTIAAPPVVTASPSLAVTLESGTSSLIELMVGGGVAGTVPSVALLVPLSSGYQIELLVYQPVGSGGVTLPPAVAGGFLVLPQSIALTDVPLLSMPSGSSLLLRAPDGSLGSVPWAALPSGGGLEQGATINLIAAATISGHRAVMVDGAGLALHADPSNPATYNFVGISLGAAATGAPVQFATPGETVVESSWAWTSGDSVFVGLNGALTNVPPVSGVSHQVATATSATAILIVPQPPVHLS